MTELVVLKLNGTIDVGTPPAKIPLHILPVAVQEWLAAARDRSANTEDAYHRAMSSWLAWCLAAGVDPHDVRRADAEAWCRWMRTETPAHRPLADRTVNLRTAACSALYRRLLAEQLVARNPFETLVRTRVGTDHLQTPALSEGQSYKLMKRALDDKEHLAHRAVIEILFTTAARAFEVAGANLGDLEPDEFGMTLWVTRKGGKRQQLPITPDALRAISEANASRSDLSDPKAPLLRAPRGGRYSRHTISRLVHRYAKGIGLDPRLAEKITAHSTRRTAITTFVDGGGDLRTAQTLAGHSDPRTTEGYVRARNDRRKHLAAATILAGKFHGED